MKKKTNVIDRFYKHFDSSNSNSCWNWEGTHREYGDFWIHTKQRIGAHQFSYMIHKGNIPKNMCICHTCDNHFCVNPAHLWLGTITENIKDRDNKNRQAKGESQACSKLTEKQVLEIRIKYVPRKYSAQKLAIEYRVSKRLILNIVNNLNWRHI